jgi:putative NADH-flavin reductase
MKLLLDEMYPVELAETLRDRGHDVVAVLERTDLIDKPDDEVAACADSEQRAVVTENVHDTSQFAAVQGFGVVLTSRRRWPRSQAGLVRIGQALDALLAEDPPPPVVRWL